MLVWSVLALFALGAVSDDTVTTEITTRQPTTSPDDVKDPEPIPYSNGGGQVFETSDELIQSFRRQRPVAPELPAVIPSGHQLPTKVPSKELEAPLDTISTSESTLVNPESNVVNPQATFVNPESIISTPGPTVSKYGSTTGIPGSATGISGSTVSIPESAPGTSPPRPTFSRSLHLRDELTVPSSDYTEVYDIEWHAESNTARTVIANSTTIYRSLPADDRVQFLKIEVARALGSEQRLCTSSPAIPASPKDRSFPGVPDMEPFQFAGYTTEEGRPVEHWQHVAVGGAGEGESLHFTHDFFFYREGEDAIPLRYTVVTDSSILGPVSDSYTHRYYLLPPPIGPIVPDTDRECDLLEEFQVVPEEKNPDDDKVVDAKTLEEMLTPTLL